jgi:hypothetical protein
MHNFYAWLLMAFAYAQLLERFSVYKYESESNSM